MNKENIIKSANYELVANFLSIEPIVVKNYFNKFRARGKKTISNPQDLRDFIEKYEFQWPGIYCIENTKNGRKYIWKSTDMYRRKYQHFQDLKKGKHSCRPLQDDFDIFGEKFFIFSIVEAASIESLEDKEKGHIYKYSPELLYNIQSNITWNFQEDELVFIKKCLSNRERIEQFLDK